MLLLVPDGLGLNYSVDRMKSKTLTTSTYKCVGGRKTNISNSLKTVVRLPPPLSGKVTFFEFVDLLLCWLLICVFLYFCIFVFLPSNSAGAIKLRPGPSGKVTVAGVLILKNESPFCRSVTCCKTPFCHSFPWFYFTKFPQFYIIFPILPLMRRNLNF